MASEFEKYRDNRLKLNSWEFGRSKASEHHLECPTCAGQQYFISEEGVECSNCGQEIAVKLEVE